MSARRLPLTRAWARQALLCLLGLLGLGLLLQGQAELQRRVLGATHLHAWPAGAVHAPDHHDGGLQAAHAHQHGHAERHHHGHDDASVVALEPLHGGDGSPSDASLGSLLQALAIGNRPAWCLVPDGTQRCPAAAAPRWRDASQRQPERPPRALA